MGDWENLYPDAVDLSSSPVAPITSSVDSVNLRTEFNSLLYGNNGEVPIGQPYLLRRMRRDSSDDLIPCICLDELTKEPDRDHFCPYCFGRGYLWDEILTTSYKVVAASPGGSNAEVNFQPTPFGSIYFPSGRFYFPSTLKVAREDRIVELELDSAGDAVLPYNRIAVYELMLVRAMRGDSGKIEFVVANGQMMGPETQGQVS